MFPTPVGLGVHAPADSNAGRLSGPSPAGRTGALSFEATTGSPREGVSGVARPPAQPVHAVLSAPMNSRALLQLALDALELPPLAVGDRLDETLAQALQDSDIDWPVLLQYWSHSIRKIGPRLAALNEKIAQTRATIAEWQGRLDKGVLPEEDAVDAEALLELQRRCLRGDEAEQRARVKHLKTEALPVAQKRIFDLATQRTVGARNLQLWQQVMEELGKPSRTGGFTPLQILLGIASQGMEAWSELVRISMNAAEVAKKCPNDMHAWVRTHFESDAPVLADKSAMLARALAVEASLPGTSWVTQPLALTRAGGRARSFVRLKSSMTDMLTLTTWFYMMSLDPDRPEHLFLNHFSKNRMRLLCNDWQQRTVAYRPSDIVLDQLLSCSEIDPTGISLIELSDVHLRLSVQFGLLDEYDPCKVNEAAVGSDICEGDPRFRGFLYETTEGRFVGELAQALGKLIKRIRFFRYRPSLLLEPGEAAPDPSSPQAWRTDILVFIASPRSTRKPLNSARAFAEETSSRVSKGRVAKRGAIART